MLHVPPPFVVTPRAPWGVALMRLRQSLPMPKRFRFLSRIDLFIIFLAVAALLIGVLTLLDLALLR